MPIRHLNRRAALRGVLATGAAIALPLPLFDCMLNRNGTAYAQGQPLAKRYATWFFGNGILPPLWVPKAVGSNWELSEQLGPLANFKDYLTVVSGLVNMFPGDSFHPVGSAASTTGGGVAEGSAVAPSIDQLVADVIGTTSPFRSIELGVSNATPNGGDNTLHAVSHRGRNAPNFPEFDPHAAFARLFAQVDVAAPDEMAKLNQVKKSVLDSVLVDAHELMGSLGQNDQHRLQQHMDGIRQLEMRLGGLGQCKPPIDPTVAGVLEDTGSEAPKAVNDVMAEILTIAFACDLTRSASLVFTLPAAHVYYRHLAPEMNDDFHDFICHADAGDSANQPRVHRGVIYAMECLATLLEKMKAVPEGDGNLLSNSLIYATSCTSWGKTHTKDEWPVLLLGKAGGALQGNTHHRAPGANLSQVLFSIASMMGVNVTSLGATEGLVQSGLSGLA